MKQGSGGKPPGRRLRFRLEYAAAFFVTAAVVFFVYSVSQASITHTGAADSPGGVTPRLRRSTLVRLGTHGQEGTGQKGADGTQDTQQPQASQAPCPSAPAKVETKTETVTKTVTKLVYSTTVQNPRAYHVVTTAQGASNHWQARIHYYWYKKQRDICLHEPACDMGGFTRVLHSGEPDDLMDEIPTVVVNPLPPTISKNTTYVVLNRPYAFIEWLRIVSIPEKYFVMCEADHLFLRPMPNFMNGDSQAAALFTYIVPGNYPDIVRKFIGNVSIDEVKKVPQIGNSPTMISVAEARAIFPAWYNTTMEIFDDKEAHEAWNWILEMYGYALAAYRVRQHEKMTIVPNMLAHPPFDKEELDAESRPFYILHLTYPCRYDKVGNFTDNTTLAVWTFDKRTYQERPPPRGLTLPPANVHNNLVRLIIGMMNEATDAIPCWDDYAKTGKVTPCGLHTSQGLGDEVKAVVR